MGGPVAAVIYIEVFWPKTSPDEIVKILAHVTDSPNDSNEFGVTPLLSMEPRMAKHYELPLTKNKDSNSGKIQWFLVL